LLNAIGKKPLTPQQVNDIFKEFDADDNKGLDKSEFKKMLVALNDGKYDNDQTH